MENEQLFASFLLDQVQGVEIALKADCVVEATSLRNRIQPIPSGLPFARAARILSEHPVQEFWTL